MTELTTEEIKSLELCEAESVGAECAQCGADISGCGGLNEIEFYDSVQCPSCGSEDITPTTNIEAEDCDNCGRVLAFNSLWDDYAAATKGRAEQIQVCEQCFDELTA